MRSHVLGLGAITVKRNCSYSKYLQSSKEDRQINHRIEFIVKFHFIHLSKTHTHTQDVKIQSENKVMLLKQNPLLNGKQLWKAVVQQIYRLLRTSKIQRDQMILPKSYSLNL